MRVLALHADVRPPRRGCPPSERKKCGTSSVGRPPTASRLNLPVEDRVRPAREIERDLRARLVHRQQEAVAPDAALVAERLAQRLAERQRAVLDGVVLVDVQVAAAAELQRESRRARDLLEHVVEEADARSRSRPAPRGRGSTRDVGCRVSACRGVDPAAARSRRHEPRRDRSPVALVGAVAHGRAARDAEVRRELQVGLAVADHVAGAHGRSALAPGNAAAARSPACGSRSRPPARCGQTELRIEAMPWESNSCSRKSCGPRKLASGNDGVPSPSWLVTMHEPVAGVAQAQQRRDHARHEAQLLAGCRPARRRGSSISVPSRSTNRIACRRSCGLQRGRAAARSARACRR